MLDQSPIRKTFTVPFQDQKYDFTVTGASDSNELVMNVARANGEDRLHFGKGLIIDRHTGDFRLGDGFEADLYAQRPALMKVNAIPGKLLSASCMFAGGLLKLGPSRVAIGTSDAALIFNLISLAFLVLIIGAALTVGLYIVLPLAMISLVCFTIDRLHFTKKFQEDFKDFQRSIAGETRELVEDTVVY